MSFQEHYASLSDDELLAIAASRADLVQEATVALDSEMAKRGLTYQQAQARRREIARLEMKEIRRHRPSPKGTKYFVARTNGWMLLPARGWRARAGYISVGLKAYPGKNGISRFSLHAMVLSRFGCIHSEQNPAIRLSQIWRFGDRRRERFRILMFSQNGFCNDSPHTSRPCQPENRRDQMNNKN